MSNIGFCHVCDRQVSIRALTLSCTICEGTFVELFDIPSAPLPNPNPLPFVSRLILPALNVSPLRQMSATAIPLQAPLSVANQSVPPALPSTSAEALREIGNIVENIAASGSNYSDSNNLENDLVTEPKPKVPRLDNEITRNKNNEEDDIVN